MLNPIKFWMLCLVSLLLASFSAAQQDKFEPEELEVYRDWMRSASTSRTLYLVQETGFFYGDGFDKSRYRLKGLRSSTHKNYQARYEAVLQLPKEVVDGTSVTFLPIPFFEFMYDGGSYIDSARASENAFGICISRVGFDPKKTQALLHVDYRSAEIPMSRHGYFFLLVKKDGKWVVDGYTKSGES